MKKDKYILLFYVFGVITFLTSVFYSVYISFAFETVLLLYALFYVMNIYNGKMKKPVLAYLFLIVAALLAYIVFFKDANLLLSLLNLAIIPIFVFTFHETEGLNKFKSMELFKILSIVLSIMFVFTRDARVCFTLVTVFPFLFMDRGFSKKNVILESIALFFIMFSRFPLIVYPALVYMIIITLYNFTIKEKKSALSTLIMCLVLLIYIPIFKVYGLGLYNSDVFGDEWVLIKVLKFLIPCIPFIYLGIKTLINLYNNRKNKFNYEMLINFLSVGGFVFLSTHLRLDYTQFIVLVGSIALFNFNKFMIPSKKVNDKKITILATSLGYDGISKYISNLTKIFDGYKIEIISSFKSVDKLPFDYGDSKITYLIDGKPNKEKFDEALENVNIFKIITEGFKSLMLFVNEKSSNLEKIILLDSKYVISNKYSNNYYIGNYLDNRFVKIASEHFAINDEGYANKVAESAVNCNYLVVVSPLMEELYKKKVSKKTKVVFIPNMLDKPSKSKAKYGTHNIITVGRLVSEKGIDELVDVVEIIKKKYPDVHLDIVGDGPLNKDLKKYISNKKLGKNITMHGFKGSLEVEKLSLDSSVYATTSHTESFGLAVLEAQNYSLPVVAFDSASGVKYLLKNGSGILVKDRNKAKMAKEIENLFDDKSAFKNYSDEAKKNANNYTINNVKPLWENIIK